MIGSSVFRESDYWLNFLFAGQMFEWNYKFSVGAGATVYYEGITGTDHLIHILLSKVSVEGGGPYRVNLYEAPTVTDGTIPQPAYNLNRRSAKLLDGIIYINPTAVSGGTLLERLLIPTGGGPNTAASLKPGIAERILKTNTKYVVSITNSGLSAGTAMINNLLYHSGN